MAQEQYHWSNVRYVVNNISLLPAVMVDQTIIQAAKSSVESFDGNKDKSEAWIALVENAAQLSGKDTLQIAFSKMVGLPLIQFTELEMDHQINMEVAQRQDFLGSTPQFLLKACNPGLCSFTTRSRWTTWSVSASCKWAFIKTSPQIRCFRFQQRALTHYTVVYSLNCKKLKDNIVEHWSVQWRSVED